MMKTILRICLLLVFLSACTKESGIKVDANGLTPDINNIVPQTTLDEMKSLGMPIFTGTTPPNIVGVYNVSPYLLKSSDVPNDYAPGHAYSDFRVQLSNQDNAKLTVQMDYVSTDQSGTGLGGFIVGSGNDFTIFVNVNETKSGAQATLVRVLSGTLSATGIKNYYSAVFMVNNGGNTSVFMANGKGRITYDGDGLSEKVASLKSARLPESGVDNDSTAIPN